MPATAVELYARNLVMWLSVLFKGPEQKSPQIKDICN